MADVSEAALKEIARCVRCGACQSVCPAYAATLREHAVARGKLHLIDRAIATGDEHLQGRRMRDAISLCLKCGRCTVACPNSVETASIVRHVREAQFHQTPKNIKTIAAGELLKNRGLLRGTVKALRAFSGVVAKRAKDRPGLVMRLAAPGEGSRRALPELPEKGFFERHGGRDVVVEGDAAGRRYLLFTGCVGDALRPQASEAMVSLARKAGVNLVAPAAQVCCGLMSYMTGDRATARDLAARNVAVFAAYNADAIVTPCASCAVMLKEHLTEVDPDAKIPAVLSLSELWSRELKGRLAPGAKTGDAAAIAFHEPCHLGVGLKVKAQPRELLGSLPGVTYVKTAGEDLCCGYGGAFNVEHYKESRAIGSRKKKAYRDKGAKIVATECAGCALQLIDVLADCEDPVEVITTAEALDRFH